MNPWPEIQAFAAQEGLEIIGVDEAGRGPLFGPVVAGAAWLGGLEAEAHSIEGLACSKTLSEKKREFLFEQICSKAPAWAVAESTTEEIDRLNILQASLLAMHRAVDQVVQQSGLDPSRCLIVVDGNKLPKWRYKAHAVVKGDVWVPAISAGSILAKVTRDRWCKHMAQQFPQFELDRHMGYPTPRHLELIRLHGICEHHRKSFRPVRDAHQNH
ncbi:MAG: ribonuclease HII [Limnobacter sp.]|nr:ribonuclease HII [Limnobacter sp.]